MGIIRSSRDQSLHVSGPKYLKGKGKQQKNPKKKFEAPKPKVENQQHYESSDSKKNKGKGHHGKEKFKCSYCGKGSHPEHACMKKKLDEATSLLERNNTNLFGNISEERQSRSGIPARKGTCSQGKHLNVQSSYHRIWSFKSHDGKQRFLLFSIHQQKHSHPHGR